VACGNKTVSMHDSALTGKNQLAAQGAISVHESTYESLPCTVHATAMHCICHCHALYMPLPCTMYVTAMHCMPLPCIVYATVMHCICHCHALYMPLPCTVCHCHAPMPLVRLKQGLDWSTAWSVGRGNGNVEVQGRDGGVWAALVE